MSDFKLRANLVLMLIVVMIPIVMVIIPLHMGGFEMLAHVAVGYFWGCVIQSLIFIIDWKYVVNHLMKKED